jgi:hypothetical protein
VTARRRERERREPALVESAAKGLVSLSRRRRPSRFRPLRLPEVSLFDAVLDERRGSTPSTPSRSSSRILAALDPDLETFVLGR